MATASQRPDWRSLEALVLDRLLGRFMWMFEIETSHGAIHAYKHIDTRRYLYLDTAGVAYRYLGGNAYEELPDAWEALGLATGRRPG